MADLGELVKAYDIRGTYPDQLDEEVTRAAGAAFVRVVGARTVVVGRDTAPCQSRGLEYVNLLPGRKTSRWTPKKPRRK
jgi:Phosphoglucomutase/phosphomannomutase, alpha/beta/alpha domain I